MTIELTDIDHVGIAVPDLEAAVDEYRRLLGVEPSHRERVEDQGVEEVLFAVGSSYVQLLGALGTATPVGRSLTSRGGLGWNTPINAGFVLRPAWEACSSSSCRNADRSRPTSGR